MSLCCPALVSANASLFTISVLGLARDVYIVIGIPPGMGLG